MDEATTLKLSQTRETTIQEARRGRFTYRYTYARSADSRSSDTCGQDYLVLREDAERLAFAVCDGVSQSFLGDLGARILGDSLVDWLWSVALASADHTELRAQLGTMLHDLTAEATAAVHEAPLPETLSPRVRRVLEKKRAQGSESMFAAGLVDTRAGLMLLVWMGDTRMRVWSTDGERTGDAAFITAERWSTSRGPIGHLHVLVAPLSEIQRLAAYTDGLALLNQNGCMDTSPSDEALAILVADAAAAPTSDDITFIEIRDIKTEVVRQWSDTTAPPTGPPPLKPRPREHRHVRQREALDQPVHQPMTVLEGWLRWWAFWVVSIALGVLIVGWANNLQGMFFGDPDVGMYRYGHRLFPLTRWLVTGCLLGGALWLAIRWRAVSTTGRRLALVWFAGSALVWGWAVLFGPPLTDYVKDVRHMESGQVYLLRGVWGGRDMLYRLFACDRLEFVCTDLSSAIIETRREDDPVIHVDRQGRVLSILVEDTVYLEYPLPPAKLP